MSYQTRIVLFLGIMLGSLIILGVIFIWNTRTNVTNFQGGFLPGIPEDAKTDLNTILEESKR